MFKKKGKSIYIGAKNLDDLHALSEFLHGERKDEKDSIYKSGNNF